MDIAKRDGEKWDIEKKFLFIAVFLSSMAGAQFMGVSLAKLALIPLELLLLSRFSLRIKINKMQKKIDCIVITAKINAIWVLVQFACWYGAKIDINDIIFNGVLRGALGENWTCWMYETGKIALRVSGFNYDTAFLSILLIFGVIFEGNWLWKTIFLTVTFFAMSRAGIITVSLIYIILGIRTVYHNRSKFLRIILGRVFIAGLGGFLLSKNAHLQYQIGLALQRLMSISITSERTVGTIRHLRYPLVALKVWFSDYNLIQKLFGIGPRVGGSGIAISSNLDGFIELTSCMKTHAWAVECDVAEILLGNGVLGMLIYTILIGLHEKIKKSLPGGYTLFLP